jgi:hypothetical protein
MTNKYMNKTCIGPMRWFNATCTQEAQFFCTLGKGEAFGLFEILMFWMCSQQVLNMFTSCSQCVFHQVLHMFTSCSQCVPHRVLNVFLTKFSMCSPPSSQYVHIKNTCSMFVMGKGKWLFIKQKKFETFIWRPWTTSKYNKQ